MRSSTGVPFLVLCGITFAARVPLPEVRKIQLAPRAPTPELDKRITCIEDDYLLSLQMYIEDSYPSCSAYLGIPETTTVTTATARTTVVIIQTTVQTLQTTETVAAGTTTVTTTVPNTLVGPTLVKRQGVVTPAAAIFSQCAQATGLNATLIHDVSSACSCLFITEKVNVEVTTVTSTRTEQGVEYDQTTIVDTVTSGEETVYYTVKPTNFGPNPNVTSATSSGAPSSSSTVPIGSPPISGPPRSGSSVSSSVPAPTGNSTAVPPTFSSSNPSTVSSPSAPSVTSIVPTSPPSLVPTPSSNSTTSSSSPISSRIVPTGTRGGPSIISSSPISPIITPTGNATTSGPSPTGTGFPTSSDCPADNGTIYTTQGQNFLIECYINYGGPVDQGLVERTLYGCVDDCAIVNVGFSQSRCYAASYFPNIVGPNCFFKTRKASLVPFHNEMTISALLLNPNNGTVSVGPTGNATSKPILSTGGTSISIPLATGSSSSVRISGSGAVTNLTSFPAPTSSVAPSVSTNAPVNATSFSSIPSLSFSSGPASGSLSSSVGNGTTGSHIRTTPFSTGTIPKAPSSQPYSTGSIVTPVGNATTAAPTGTGSTSSPSFSLSQPSQSRIINLNSTTAGPTATSSGCTSYVYSTSVIYSTSIIYTTSVI